MICEVLKSNLITHTVLNLHHRQKPFKYPNFYCLKKKNG